MISENSTVWIKSNLPKAAIAEGAGFFDDISSMAKVGSTPTVTTATVPSDVWDFGGIYTYSTSAVIDTVSSSSALDEHFLLINGLDENWQEVSQSVQLAGQNKVSLPTALIRAHRMQVVPPATTNLTGNVYLYENGATTGGIPDDTSSIRAYIASATNYTQMALYTIPSDKTGYLLRVFAGLAKKQTAVAELSFSVRPTGGIFQQRGIFATSSTTGTFEYRPEASTRIPSKTDVKISVIGVTSDLTVNAGFELLLKDN